MLILAAAIVASASPPQPQRQFAGASVQARATIRVISGAILNFSSAQSSDGQKFRDAVIPTSDGPQRAKLIEFE